MSAVSDALNGAADLILRDGWCQNQYRDVNGCRCITRALADACGVPIDCVHWWHHQTYRDADAVLRRITGRNSISGWNDDSGRTKAEVVAALRTGAKEAA